MMIACLSICLTVPVKSAWFQPTRMPPDAPIDGEKANLPKRLGAIFLKQAMSKFSHFVSWMQKIAHALSSILFLTALHLSSAFIPLMFQFSTFHCLLLLSVFMRESVDLETVIRVKAPTVAFLIQGGSVFGYVLVSAGCSLVSAGWILVKRKLFPFENCHFLISASQVLVGCILSPGEY